ncbi:hypothetical protein PCC79_08020 [Propioniciclava soli]|uniref:DUF2236 domain-containing protein n=1 Tax=Propioniciclava soli TaxID=2775081 RepID=A0ABZ3CEZ5_9ACTN
MTEPDDAPADDEREEHAASEEPVRDGSGWPEPGSDAASSQVLGRGRNYAASFMPSFDFRGIIPNLDFSGVLAPHLESLQRVVATNFTAVLAPASQNLQRGLAASGVFDSVQAFTVGTGAQYEALLAGLRINLKPLIDPGLFDGLNRRLPPNLRSASDKITMMEVHDFVKSEGIPLYLVPRASIGARLVRASTRAARRQVLSDRFDAIVQDCTTVIDRCDDPMVATAVHFVRDGLGAVGGGHFASAQAIFTLVLDTMIMEFYPDQEQRRKITNRRPGSKEVPEIIEGMGLREAYVWLPIWNAHEQFWKDKGDAVPYTFSRHASVHGASKRQYSKRNCVQVLMLVTSLIGYADRLGRNYRAKELCA